MSNMFKQVQRVMSLSIISATLLPIASHPSGIEVEISSSADYKINNKNTSNFCNNLFDSNCILAGHTILFIDQKDGSLNRFSIPLLSSEIIFAFGSNISNSNNSHPFSSFFRQEMVHELPILFNSPVKIVEGLINPKSISVDFNSR